MTSAGWILLHSSDDVVTAIRPFGAGEQVAAPGREAVATTQPIMAGHKIALRAIETGELVRKYGQPIGLATQPIPAGGWVHSHNLRHVDTSGEYEFATDVQVPPMPAKPRFFRGYRRPTGKVGTRNYVAVVSTVNCSASVSKRVARAFDREALAAYPNVDGVIAITHGEGCGLPYGGMRHAMLNRVLAGYARHPNVGGVVLIGLGCEQNAMGFLTGSQNLVRLENLDADGDDAIPMLVMQDQGGTRRTIEEGIRQVERLLPRVNAIQRVDIPASELIVGLECGGSDAHSGLASNPVLGSAADLLVAHGGTAVLSETPEIYGAEQLLTRRAVTREVGEKLLERIAWWKRYVGLFDAKLDDNPSPGNKAGGLTTIAEKSLGAVSKGGTTALRAVFEYAEPITERGFVVMDTPGYDPASVTGITAGGCQIVVFTTGRGSCFGSKPAPTIKVASNTPLFERMPEDMDFDAGVVLSGASLEAVGADLFDRILAVASGEPTKSEALDLGDEEFVPWTVGPTL
jgi:altronate hydrolase